MIEQMVNLIIKWNSDSEYHCTGYIILRKTFLEEFLFIKHGTLTLIDLSF